MITNLDLPSLEQEHVPTDFAPFEEATGPGADLRKEATAAWNRGDKDQAASFLQAALNEDLPPIHVASALELLGEIHLGRGELQEGITYLLRCLATRPLTAGSAQCQLLAHARRA